MDNNEVYRKLARNISNSNLKGKVYAFKPKVDKNDIKRGFIERRFVQQCNDNQSPITEISKSSYGNLQSNPLYKLVKLRWRIDGTVEEIKNSNRASISEHLRKMPQLKNRLVNLLEYRNNEL